MPSGAYRYLALESIARSVGPSWQKSALGLQAPTGTINGLPGTGVSAPSVPLITNAATAPAPLEVAAAYKYCPLGSIASAGRCEFPGIGTGDPETAFNDPSPCTANAFTSLGL